MKYQIIKVEVLDETIQTTVKYDLIDEDIIVSNFAPQSEKEILDTIEVRGGEELVRLKAKIERVAKNEEIAKLLSVKIDI
jgi:trans-2-enoyl-CoA reductase